MKPRPLIETASELQLIARARRGEEAAFAALYELHSQRVYSFCLSITGATEEAEELTRDIFLEIFRRILTFKEDSEFARALEKMLTQLAINIRTKQRLPTLQYERVRCEKAELSLWWPAAQVD